MGSPSANIPQEDLPFRHYTAKHRLISWVSRNLFDNITYTAQHGLLQGMKRKGGLGWMPGWIAGGAETEEHRFWKRVDLNGLVVYDVGAFEGLLTVFFASRAKHVICYEPNTRNYNRLQENLRLNGLRNVTVRKMGAGESSQNLEMIWDKSMPGGASVETATVKGLKSAVPVTSAEVISITTLDRDIEEMGLPAPDFIKIDIEGWEIHALRGAQNTLRALRPSLFLEMHGETLREKKRRVAEIVSFLGSAGYSRIEHIESGQLIDAANSEIAVEGHLYCPSRRQQA
jgi:FkbM family methyltransferase